MSKLLILLLFALVYNEEIDDIPVYVPEKMIRISDTTRLLKVKQGEEFYIKIFGNPSIWAFYSLRNYEEIPDALDDFGKKGHYFKYVPKLINGKLYPGEGGHFFYKFKALKPNTNEISLKYFYSLSKEEGPHFVVNIDILPEN